MKKIFFHIILLSVLFPALRANDIDDYFIQYKTAGRADYQAEKAILESYKLKKLIDQLSPYYSDSIVDIKQKAYYLTYKKGVQEQEKSALAVNQLLKGCYDRNGGIVGQNLDYLKSFPPSAFDSKAKEQIKELLGKRHAVHFKKLAMLAGYVGAASEVMEQQLLIPDISVEKKWALSLALARQGNAERIEYCVNGVKKMPVGNDLMNYIVPDLIYTRQKEAIDYCITILNNDEKLCLPSDPDKQEKILCGYYLMELLAPAIAGFPFKTDGTGSLVTDDYESALKTVRDWFKANPDYTVNREQF